MNASFACCIVIGAFANVSLGIVVKYQRLYCIIGSWHKAAAELAADHVIMPLASDTGWQNLPPAVRNGLR